MEARPEFAEEGTFDPAEFVDELRAAPSNHRLGTSVWFENDRIRVWEVLLEPGQRGEFHAHARLYPKVIVHGHTPVAEADVKANRVNVDTGACFTGRLSALAVDGASKRILVATEAGVVQRSVTVTP